MILNVGTDYLTPYSKIIIKKTQIHQRKIYLLGQRIIISANNHLRL